MCGRCVGEPYRGVFALFNGDLQNQMDFIDREDWLVVSQDVIVYLGASSLANEVNPLFRGCDNATSSLSASEINKLGELSLISSRPVMGDA